LVFWNSTIEDEGALHLCNVRNRLPIDIASPKKNRIILHTAVKTSKLARKLVPIGTKIYACHKGIRNYAFKKIHQLIYDLLRTICYNNNCKWGRKIILSKYLALERNLSNCEEKEKKAPVLSIVYLLNGSQLLGEAALGQHRQQ
jgi:hypothetical protein